MGATSSPDPPTIPFKSGMPRLVFRLAIPLRGTLTGCGPLLTLPMGATSSPDPTTAPFKSGMPRLVLQSAILLRGTLTRCCLLLSLPMGRTSSPDPTTAPFESGMPRLVLQSAILLRGTLTGCGPLLTLLMGGILSLDPMTASLKPGMPRLILQLESLPGSILSRSRLFHTPQMRSTSFLGLMTTPPVYWIHFRILLSDLPLVTQHILVFVQSPTRMVGSRTQRVVYYTGYPTTVVYACIHLPS